MALSSTVTGRDTKKEESDSSGVVVANARIATGLDQVLRCASTDALASVLLVVDNSNHFKAGDLRRRVGPMDTAILQRAGLILDLRSPSERNERQAQRWMASTAFVVQELLPEEKVYSERRLQEILQLHPRLVFRLDILSPTRFMKYLEEQWLSPTEQIQATMFHNGKVVDDDRGKLHRLRMQTLNQRGLLGLNEAILETGQQGLCTALQIITLYLERLLVTKQLHQQHQSSDESSWSPCCDLIVIHCVQGKDRTGLLIMLCQAIMGVSDFDIIQDYHRSHNARRRKRQHKDSTNDNNSDDKEDTSAAMERVMATSAAAAVEQGSGLDRSIVHGAPRHVMQYTLDFLRSRYGSVTPGYLNHIGFDASWQRRFQQGATAKNKNGANIFKDGTSGLPTTSKL